jgi:hypothetical protein
MKVSLIHQTRRTNSHEQRKIYLPLRELSQTHLGGGLRPSQREEPEVILLASLDSSRRHEQNKGSL